MTTICPSRDQLLALHRGALPEDRAQSLIAHVAECAACRATTDSFGPADDTVMAQLRMPAPKDPFADEAPLQEALANVRAMAGEASTTGGVAVAVAELPADAGPATVTFEPAAIELPQLGEYEILEKLGQGGMGAVYKARHRRLDKIVAVKVLPPDRMADPLALARFDREMKAVGRLDHPNIVRAMDAREIDGTHFLAMEYVAGMDLGDVVLNVGAMRVADACEVVRQIAAGLQCAHENGLVHRDIKPSNAILTPGGQVKLLDLGLARLGGGDANGDASHGEMTTSGTAMGTADYMAPEQASDSHTADIRADIYSLGCTLYKLLSGKAPFSSPKYKNNMEKIIGHMRDAPPPIGLLRSDVSADLAAVIDRLMAKEREARLATPQEVFDALLPFAVGANLPRLYREADAMQRGEPLPEPSVLGTEPGASSAANDTARHLACGDLSPLLSDAASPAKHSEVSTARPMFSHFRRPAVLVALGLVASAVLAGVIVIRIVQKSGKETIVEVPEGDLKSVTIEEGPAGGPPAVAATTADIQSGDKSPHSKTPVGVWVPLVASEADLAAWQKTGAGTVTFDNGAVRVENAAVTYPTLAVDLVIRVQIQVEVSVKPTARLVLRETPAGSYAAVLEDGTKLVVGVTEGDQWRELKSAPVTVAADQPLALEFSAVGNVLTVLVNGKPAIEVQDSTHTYGAPGLAATDGATVFRGIDVKVVRPKEVELAKTMERPQASNRATSPPSVATGPSVAKTGDKAPHSKKRFPIGQWVPVLTSEQDLAQWEQWRWSPTDPLQQIPQESFVRFTEDGIEVSTDTFGRLAFPIEVADVAIRVRVKRISGDIMLRLREGPAGYYGAFFNGSNFGYGAGITGGGWRNLYGAQHRESFTDFFDFEFAAVGNQLLAFVDGLLIFRVEDTSVTGGFPGFRVMSGRCLFRDVQIKVLTSRDDTSGPLPVAEQERLIAELEAEHLPPWNLADGAPPPAIAPFNPTQARQHQEAWATHLGIPVEETNSIGMKLVLLPPGEYGMGLTPQEFQVLQEDVAKANLRAPEWYTGGLQRSTPKRTVRVFRPFQIGAHEVTLDQFRQFALESGYKSTGETSRQEQGLLWRFLPDESFLRFAGMSWRHPTASSTDSDQPVVNVSFEDANAFADWLSRKEGVDYRLPTEEEWEYACRGGGDLKYGFVADVAELSNYAWLDDARKAIPDGSQHVPQAVGMKRANPFGVYDLLGNVHEMCFRDSWMTEPTWGSTVCVLRGLHFIHPSVAGPHVIRVSYRDPFSAGLGFRMIRDLPRQLEQLPADATAAERWVASWLVQHGAQLTIRIDGQDRSVNTVAEFPTEPFQVEAVTLGVMADFVPAELAYLQYLPNLKVLRLSGMRINDRAVARLAGLKSVQDLRIEACPISPSGWAYLAKMENVRRLTFANQPITDEVLAQWNGFPNLESLHLANQPITDAGLKHVGALRGLRVLNLSQTKVGDAGLQHLRDLKQLTELNLASTLITDNGLAHLAGCESLEMLDLGRTAITGTGLAPLAQLGRLSTLILSFSKLNDEGCAAIGRLRNLQTLRVRWTSISDAGVSRWADLKLLRLVDLVCTDISDAGLQHLAKLPQLEDVNLASTIVGDEGIQYLEPLTRLRGLNLSWVRATSRSLPVLAGLSDLENLSLLGTWVTDTDASQLARLVGLRHLLLRCTDITPAKVAELQGTLPSCAISGGGVGRDAEAIALEQILSNYGDAWAKIRPEGDPPQIVRGMGFRSVTKSFFVLELSARGSHFGNGLLSNVRLLREVTHLDLTRCSITNRGLEDLRDLKTLETLVLDANPIGDAGIEHLTELANLRSLSIRGTQATAAGVRMLSDKLPNCRIESDWFVARTGGPLFPQSPATQPGAIAGLRSWSVLPAAHRDSVSAIACCPDGGFVAVAGDDGENFPATIRVWALGAEQKPGFMETAGCTVLLGHDKKIDALAWSPNGKYIASTGQDSTVKCWDPATGRLLRTFLLNSPGYALAWSPSGDRIAVARGTAIALIDIKTGDVQEIANSESKGAVAWLPDGNRFLVQSSIGTTATLTVYDARTLDVDRSIRTAELTGRSAALSPDGKQIAAAYAGKMVRVWDVETCERVRELRGDDGEISHVAWSPAGDRLATVGKSLVVWDAKGERLTTVELESAAALGVSWTADGRHVAVALPTAVDLYSAADGALADTLAVTGKIAQARLTIAPDGHYRAAGPIADQLVYVALTDDYHQATYTPAAFAEKHGWKN